MNQLLLIVSVSIVSVYGGCSTDKNLVQDLTFKLSGSDLTFPCSSTKDIYSSTGRWISKNIIATRLQMFKDHAIVALPRYRSGIPFTLAKFSLKSRPGRVDLEPFPCWNIQEEGNCNAIQNAIDLALDSFENLWVLDMGICNTLEQPVKRCSPKIWGIKTETGEIIKRIDLEPFVSAESRIQYLVIDYTSDGVPYAYISDAGTAAIIVINIQCGTGFRVVLPCTVTDDISCRDILYLQLARKSTGNVLYFTYFSSPSLFSINATSLQNGQVAQAISLAGTKPSDTKLILLGTDNGSAVFFRYKGDSDIYVWNSNNEFKPKKFLMVQRGGYCRMATQVVPGWKKLMWAIESNFHDYITSTTGCLGASVVVYPIVKTIE